MIKLENILGVICLLGLGFSISFPYLAHADASVNGFFPKDFVFIAGLKNHKVSKKNNDTKPLATQLSSYLVKKSDFAYNNQDENGVDTFSIPKEYPNITKD